MSIKITKEEIEKRLTQAPSDVLNLVFALEQDPAVSRLISKYQLDETRTADITHKLMVTILGFYPFDDLTAALEEILNIKPAEAKEEFELINSTLFSKTRNYIDAHQKRLNDELTERVRLGLLDKKALPINSNILNEIENPTPSIQPVVRQTAGSAALPNLGGFAPVAPATNPAAPIVEKLDQKLSEATSSAPKEIYQVKKSDPYHEPIEA